MAIMRPSEFPEDRRNEEDREYFVYEMLKENLPPDAIVIYEPRIYGLDGNERKPDFVIFWPKIGCVILECKKWHWSTISHADTHTVYFKGGKRMHPLQHADQSMYAVMSYLKRQADHATGVLSSSKQHEGKLAFCVKSAIAALGGDDADKVGRILKTDPKHILSEDVLKTPESLQQMLQGIPSVFQGTTDFVALHAAADLIHPASDEEASADAIVRSIALLDQRLNVGSLDSLEQLTADRKLLSMVAENLANHIANDNEQHPTRKNLVRLRDDLLGSRLQVGMFGTSSAGKSTLTNALIGKLDLDEDLMKQGNSKTTRVITRILPIGDSEAEQHRCSIIRYKSTNAVMDELHERLELLGIEKEEYPEKADRINLSNAKHRTWLAGIAKAAKGAHQMEQADQALALEAMLDGWSECEDLLGAEVPYDASSFANADALIHGDKQPHLAFVDERVVYHENRLTQHGIELVDAPGNGVNCLDDQRALRIAQSVDAFLLITDVNHQFMQSDRNFIQNVIDVERERRSNLIFLLNKISAIYPDQCDPPADTHDEAVARQVDRLRSTLLEYSVEDVEIWPVDAEAGKVARRMKTENIDQGTKEKFERSRFRDIEGIDENLAASRLEIVEDRLITYLTKNTYTDAICDKLSQIEKAMSIYDKDLSVRLENEDANADELVKEKQKHEVSYKQVSRSLYAFFNAELPKHLAKYEPELNEDVEKLSDLAIDLIIKYTYKLWKKKINTIDLINASIDKACPEIEAEIKTIRDKHERYWNEIKRQAIDKEIPEILSQYGDGRLSSVELSDIGSAVREGVRALQGIHLGGYQKAFAVLWGGLMDLVTLNWEDSPHYKASVENALRGNYESLMKDRFRTDIYGWISDDQDRLQEHTRAQFEDLMDEQRRLIDVHIADLETCDGNRVKLKERLKKFQEVMQTARERMHRIRRRIETHRPM